MAFLQEPASPELLSDLSWHTLVVDDDPDALERLCERLWDAAQTAKSDGDAARAGLLALLASATSLRLTVEAKPPFQPLMVVGSERTAALSDLSPNDVAALAALAPSAPTVRLRAHLADVAATAGHELDLKEWKSGMLAAESYLDLAEAHLLSDRRYAVLEPFRRGLHLAWVYCKSNSPLRDRYWTLLVQAIAYNLEHAAPGYAYILAAEMVDRRRDLGDQAAPLFEARANECAAAGLHDLAALCFDWAAKLWYAARRNDDGNRCRQSQGRQLVAKSDGPGLATVRAMSLMQGIEVLKRARAPEEVLRDLHIRLDRLQRQSMNDFQVHVASVDVTEDVQQLNNLLVGPKLFDSLMQMAFKAASWPDPDAVRTQVVRRAQRFVLGALFSAQHLDNEGKVVASRGAFDADDPVQVEQEMVHSLRQFECRYRADVVIVRCVDHLFTHHHPPLPSIREIVEASGMIPEGHTESVARGLFAGINGEWLEAAVYLLPKFEPIIRQHFRVHGINTMVTDDAGTQHEMNITQLLDHRQAVEVLSPALLLELKTLLTHQVGYCLRHHWAHGRSDDDEIINPGLLCAWWTLWRMVLVPWAPDYFKVAAEPPADAEPEA